jgi:hypothetical protein
MAVKKSVLEITVDAKLTDKQQKKQIAEWLLSPEVSSAAVTEAYSGGYLGDDVSFNHMIDACNAATKQLGQDNAMEYVERLLLSQSIALNNLFVSLARKSAVQEYVRNQEIYLRLALKAQSQSRATLETLAAVKNPPVVFAKTANIAQNQQINNGAPPAQQVTPSDQSALTNEQGESIPTTIKQEASR